MDEMNYLNPVTDPFKLPMVACLVCGTFFYQANAKYEDGEMEVVCPHPLCEASQYDFGAMLEAEVDEAFHGIIGCNFDELRVNNLTIIARLQMGRANPLSRLL